MPRRNRNSPKYIPCPSSPYDPSYMGPVLIPSNRNIPLPLSSYRPFEDRHGMASRIQKLWQIPPITAILLPNGIRSRSNCSSVFRVLTSDPDCVYEYTETWTGDYDAGPLLLRRLYPDGKRDSWVEGSGDALRKLIREEEESRAREAREAKWEHPLAEVTEEEEAAVMGLMPLKWMGLRATEKCHAAVFWLKRGKPSVESEKERDTFVKEWEKHQNDSGCTFQRRECNEGQGVEDVPVAGDSVEVGGFRM
ncbi:hypothetical protein BJ508DRAFT_313994 [Ascobolus immersus RN42]|uniref:Uncharacterized protein n=1 Tax=Ascobolus immersus RN42 TaxID=1160509 RepID=A0A3N4HGN0_ASCIM|nr:hypothetical protein BJ508DRAFT_313994 [Ascobolus immersus RN42]